jgi:hypothetical protein
MRSPRPELTAAVWRRSSYSSNNGGSCVEVAENLWRRSSYSSDNGGTCVEVADNVPGALPVRDSKNPHGPALAFPPSAWTAFLTHLRDSNG